MFPRKVFLLVFLAFLCSCKENKKPHGHSFYYWKTTFDYPDTLGQGETVKLGVNHFYVHFFDVDWSENLAMPVPKGEADMHYHHPFFMDMHYTPVVVITNRTFERMSEAWCDSLARKITQKIGRMRSDTNQRELQIDCDWTVGTKDKYFMFLKAFKAQNPGLVISATIRLYPYKYYKKLGVPPVDRGMLMCYNMGSAAEVGTKNSIFDVEELKKYLGGNYPLPLDVGLPIFHWQVWFRNGQFKGIIHTGKIPDDTVAIKEFAPHRYRFTVDTVINDVYYREGDELRREAPDTHELEKAIGIINDKLPDYVRITFFDWNDSSIAKYEKVIEDIYNY